MKNYCVLYCAENQDIAQILKTTLTTDQVNIDLVSCQEQQGMSAKLARTASAEAVIALISDNFLKGEGCMYQAYELFQQLYHSNRLLSVIIDGKRDGNIVPTSIERVSNVIQYMNFWQEQYLEMRRAHTIDETKLNIVRGISSEVGDFLRFLREIDYLPWDQFKANNWQIFAQLSGSYIPFRPDFEVIESSIVPSLSTTPPPTITAVPTVEIEQEELVEALVEVETIAAPSVAVAPKIETIVTPQTVVAETTIATIVTPTPVEAVHIEAIKQDIPGVITFVNDAARGILKPVSSNGIKNGLLPDKPANKANEIDEDDFFNKVKEEKKQSDSEHQTLNDMVEEVLREEEQDDQYGLHDIMEIEEEDQDDAASLDYLFDDDDEEEWEVETLSSKIDGTNSDTSEKTNTPIVAEMPVIENIIPVEAITEPAVVQIQENVALMEEEEEEEPEEDNTAILNELEAKLVSHANSAIEKPLPSLDLIMTNIQNGNVNEGLAQMHRVLENEPANTNLRMHYAILLAKDQNNISGAVEQLENVLQYDSRNTDAYFLLAEIAEMHGDYIQCRSYYEKVAEIDPTYQDIYYKLGILTATHFEKDAAEAGNYFKTSLIYNDKNADAAYQYALLLQDKLGKEKKAIKWFTRTLEINPEHPFANYDLAMIHHGRQERAEALDFYLRACDITPEFRTEANDKAFYYSVLDSTRASEAINLHLGTEDKRMTAVSEALKSEITEITAVEAVVESASEIVEVPTVEAVVESASEAVEVPTVEVIVESASEAVEVPTVETIVESTSEAVEVPTVETIVESASEVVEVPNIEAIAATLGGAAVLTTLNAEIENPKPETPNSDLETPKTAISYRLPKVNTKIALITGATAGIGKATAEVFAKAGYSLILTGRREERLELLQADIQAEFDTHSVVLPFDIRDLSATKSAVEHLDQAWCNVDILINNAGLAKGFDPIHSGNIEDWETMIDTNIKGLLYMTRLISPFMVARKTGHIINLSSTAGKEAYLNGNVYCATKFAVEALTKTMRMDLVAHNIRVSQIAPGHVEETEFALTRFDGNVERAAKVYENFQPLRAIDVAETILFIATRPAHVNIQDILIASTQQASATMVERSGR
jgi:NADP-dependent 3-hydroxy acid dehydrogenase YdfG/tetratricopeptide (TPR) repeat protein